MTVDIKLNETERIRVTALSSGAFATGLTDVLLEIRRLSDGYYYDFNDTSFKASGWTTRQQQMSELDATNSAGTYYYDFNTTGLSADEYYIRASSATATNSPWENELVVGGFKNDIVTIDGIVDAILVDTGTTLDGKLTTIKEKVDTIDTVVDKVEEAHFNRRKHDKDAQTVTIYDSDDTTPKYVFDATDDLDDITPQ